MNSRMDSRDPRVHLSVLREDRIAVRLARVMNRYRDCHQIERLIIHSDGGIDVQFREPRPDYAHSPRSTSAHVRSMGPTTPRARPVLTPRQVKKNERAADHQAALAAVAASRSTSSNTNPNPKVRKSGAVAKAALASMVLEEGSVRAAQGDSRDIRRTKETSAARSAGVAVYLAANF